MKPALWTQLVWSAGVLGAALVPSRTGVAEYTARDIPEVTPAPLAKRKGGDAKVNKEYQKLQEQKENLEKGITSTSDEPPSPWVYTQSDDVKRIITPTVVGTVTLFTQPPKKDADLAPWVSLKKNGEPKMIKPKRAGDGVKNGPPDYGTWFATPTTVEHEIDGEVHAIKEMVDRNEEEHRFDPVLRCTPERYGKKGVAKNQETKPFCTPIDEGKPYLVNETYFITWYSGFYKNEEDDDRVAEKVKLHISGVKQAAHRVGLKRSVELDAGGKVLATPVFTSDWISNTRGWYALKINEEWLGKMEERKLLLSLQPDYMDDEEFNHVENHVVIGVRRKTIKTKDKNVDLDKMQQKMANKYLGLDIEEDEDSYEKYYVALTIPTAVCLAGLFMYLFVFINRKSTDLSGVRRRTFARENTTKKKLPWKKKTAGYTELPQYNNTKHD
ncbi:PMA1 stabilization in the Golgi protein 1 [Diutina catenulata]